jgi:beta-mannosidase
MEWYRPHRSPTFLTRMCVVWHNEQRPYQDYPLLSGRFISEFGMQSFPSSRTIRFFTPSEREYFPQSSVLDNHNKAMGFEHRLGGYILENFRLAEWSVEEWVKTSQRMQADALASAFRGWRRLWRGEGKEYCSGALVWQVTPRITLSDVLSLVE